MTTLGKILVIVNFVFTLVTGALIIMVFLARTNWKNSYDKLNKYYEVSQANVKTYAEESKLTRIEAEDKVKAVEVKLAVAEKDRDQFRADLAEKDKEVKRALEVAKTNKVVADTATAELGRLQDELRLEQTKVVERDKKLVDLETRAKDLLDKFVRADIQARSSNDRAQRLEETMGLLYKEIEKLKVGSPTGPGGTAIVRKPPEDVEGIITETDLKSGLVTISIGSDAGISKGNTLEVFNLAQGKYKGKIYILEVKHNEAVGRPMNGQQSAPIQKGDKVASNIR